MEPEDQRLIDRIKHLIANPPEGSVVLEITPAVALYILQNWRGTHNRIERRKDTLRYAAAMAAGNWRVNGETISFHDIGVLAEGQHRLLACVRAGKPFKTHVVFNVAHEDFASINQGRSRSPSDVLHIAGVENANIVHPAVRWAELLANIKSIKGRATFEGQDILELYQTKHKGVEDFIKEARAIVKANEHQSVPILMAVLYTFDKRDSEMAGQYSANWSAGTFPGAFRAIQIMQHELAVLAKEAKKNGARPHDLVRPAMIINAWNIVRGDIKPRAALIRWNMTMPFPEIK